MVYAKKVECGGNKWLSLVSKKKQMVIATAKIFMASNDCKNTNISLRKGYFHKIKFGVVRQQTKLGCGNRLL
jgi:hypothetical protein